MKVLYISGMYPTPDYPQKGIFCHEQVKALKQIGVDVDVVVPMTIYDKEYKKRTWNYEGVEIQYIRFFKFPGVKRYEQIGRSLYVSLLLSGINFRKYDIIHADAPLPAGDAALRLSNKYGIPFIVHGHGLDVFFDESYKDAPNCQRIVEVCKKVYKQAEAVIGVSQKVLDCIQKRIDIREKGKVVYNGVDIDKFYPTDKKSEEKYILATGNLIALKGHDDTIKAFAELKKAGNKLVWLRAPKDQYDLPDYAGIMDQYEKLHKDMQDGKVVSAYALDRHGIAAAVAKMAFGNGMGVKIEHNLDPRDFFAPGFGDIILEVPDGKVGELSITYTVIGEVTADGNFSYGNTVITVDEAENAWKGTLEKVFKTVSSENDKEAADRDEKLYRADSIYVCKNKVAKPRVFIPVFPGTNCEYDTAKAFENAGANVITKVFKNLTPEDIRDSVKIFEDSINQAQIIMFPGGFSAGDEPDGSAKFFATAFRNAKIEEAVHKLLNERDGLALGICNGFQALIKLGLVPNGKITGQDINAPTLTYNTINRHVSKMVYTKVVSNKSPWLQEAELGGVYVNPASHGEGRFVAPKECIEQLFANGQVATQYVNQQGQPTMDEEWNVNGSYMAIEGITSPDGRCFGKMAHIERKGTSVATNIYGEQDLKVFESGVHYFA